MTSVPSAACQPTTRRHNYLENGYVLAPSLFSRTEVEAVRREAKEIFNLQLARCGLFCEDLDDEVTFQTALRQLFQIDYAAFLGAAKLTQQMVSLHQLSMDGRVHEIVQELGVSHPVICVKPILYFNSRHLAKKEGHYKTPPHQDWRSMQGSLDSIVIWIALCDIDQKLGALEVVPQSHKLGLLETVEDPWYRTIPPEILDESRFVPIEVRAGDTLFFSAFTAHRSGNNVTDDIRWSIHFRYNNAQEATYIERRFPHPYAVYQPDQAIVTPDFPSVSDLETIFS